MRIKELADLTGTTVRTIRYYHQIDLLPIPGLRYGYRDYDLVHVARLTRIRWLTQAGLPLSAIGDMLHTMAGSTNGADRDLILTDLNATLVALDDHLERLQVQRDHIHRLVASVERDDQLSPMPRSVVRFYDDMEHRAVDERVRRVIRQERDFMELAFYRGDLPPEAAVLYEGFTDARLAESLALFDAVAERSHPAAAPTADQIAQIAAAVVARIRRHVGPDWARVARSIDLDVARRAADLYVRLADEHDRDLGRAIGDALLAALEQARSPTTETEAAT